MAAHQDDQNDGDVSSSADELDFVSQATFVLWPSQADAPATEGKKRRGGKKRKHAAADTETTEESALSKLCASTSEVHGGFVPLMDGAEPAEYVNARYRCFHTIWTHTENTFNDILKDLNHATFDQVVEFTRKATQESHKRQLARKAGPYQELPTALLFAGVNVMHYENLFDMLASRIRDTAVACQICMLRASDCTSVGATITSLISQCKIADRGLQADYHIILSWYREEIASARRSHAEAAESEPARKKQKKRGSRGGVEDAEEQLATTSTADTGAPPPLVLIFEDFEALDADVIKELLPMFSMHQREMPVVLVCGMATSVAALHQKLPFNALGVLAIEQFHTPSARQCLDAVLDRIVLHSEMRFRLGPQAARVLLESFFEDDLSVLSFVKRLQFAMIKHFHENPLSFLCNHDSNDELPLLPAHLEVARRLPSFRTYIQKQGPLETLALLGTDKKSIDVTTAEVKRLVDAVHEHSGVLYQTLSAISRFTQALPSKTLSFADLVVRYLHGDAREESYWEPYFKSIKGVVTADFEALALGLENLSGASPHDVAQLTSELARKLREVAADVSKRTADATAADEGHRVDDSPQKRRHQALRRGTQFESSAARLQCTEEVAAFFKRYLAQHLLGHDTLPLHEAICFDDATAVERAFNTPVRGRLREGLRQAHRFINCECCDGQGEPKYEDFAIAYRYFEEAGKLINLFDWFQDFSSFAIKDDDTDDKTLMARFNKVIQELHYMGFVKMTKRKTDHLMKLDFAI